MADAGSISSNVWSCQDGFNLPIKPRFGDLFGTRVQSTPRQFALSAHTWAAEDRGARVEGFKDNVVIGRLGLNGNPQSFLQFDAVSPAGNALYVDFLNLEGPVLDAFNTNDLESILGIGLGFAIYFADSNVPAEELDGQLNGQIRWVKDFAGPNSSVDVLRLDGRTVKMNRPLRFSTTIDSDGDGVANAYDAYPLDAGAWNSVTLSFQGGLQSPFKLSWMAAPDVVYLVETTTNLSTPNWQSVTNYTNLSATSSSVTLSPAVVNTAEAQRYYRIRYTP